MTGFTAPMVSVEWLDAASGDHRWTDRDDVENVAPTIRTIGWVLAEDPLAITLAMSIRAESPDVMNTMTIPIGCVISIDPLTAKAAPQD